MKKKLLFTTAIMLLVIMCTMIFAGCDEIFTQNEERDANQVVATVSYTSDKYGTQTGYVYKYELQSSFDSYAYAYVYYYSMTYEGVADYLCQSLAQQKLLRLFAKDKVSQYMGLDAIPSDITELLSDSELNKAIEEVNEDFYDSLLTLIEEAITEDNYNTGTTTDEEEEEDVEVTDPVYVRFNANGGSDVEKQKIQKGYKAEEPTEPTKDGYTFYGWYINSDFSGDEFDFENTAVSSNITLYAKWVEHLDARTVKEEEEEDEDADYDPDKDGVEISDKFFTTEYYNEKLVASAIKEEEEFEDMVVPTGSTEDATVKTYVDDAMADLKKNLEEKFYQSYEDCYAYYLNSQLESLLVTKLERLIGEGVTVTREEVETEFARALAQNKETFASSSTSYASALADSLSSTYYHPYTTESYGFVINILLKLDDDSLEKLTDMYTANPANTEAVRIMRNKLISEMQIHVSNPDYDEEAVLEDENGDEIELRDAMTDPNNKYNQAGTEYNKDNDYSQIISFEKNAESGEFEIVYNAKEHPTMAYLLNTVPAFDTDSETGIIHQIYNSFDQVKAYVTSGDLTKLQGIYWLREVATAWLYLVGDDSGSVSSDSNNGGLGYVITPEGEDSSYLDEFTDYARALIGAGTGSYAAGTVDENTTFSKCSADGTFAGDGVAFVVADSFISSGSTSSAYTGVFVLLNSLTVWDSTATTTESADGTKLESEQNVVLTVDADGTGVLPYNYVVTYAADMDDVKTIYDTIYDSLLEGKQEDAYNLIVNNMGLQNVDSIEYNEKAYKSLWKDLD